MNAKFTVKDQWSGSPMKMDKRYTWTVNTWNSSYKCTITSKKFYDTPESAYEGYLDEAKHDPMLSNIVITEPGR